MKIRNFEDLDQVLLEAGQLQVELTKKEAEMNAKIQKIRDQFEQATESLREKLKNIETDIQAFCLKNKTEFDKERKKELIHGFVGFRTNPPKVLQLNKKFTVKTTIELIKKIFNGKYIRTKEELNKDLILTDYSAKELTDDKLAAIGLRIDQDETFYYEINWELINK